MKTLPIEMFSLNTKRKKEEKKHLLEINLDQSSFHLWTLLFSQ